MTIRIYLSLLTFFWGAFLLSGCRPTSPAPELMESAIYPTPAGSLPELIENLSSNDMLVRIVSMRALRVYGPEAAQAIPALIPNLYYRGYSSIRREAVIALEIIGPPAHEAVPDLINVLQTDDAYQVRVSAADALGKIGIPSAVPALANTLYEDENQIDSSLLVACAEAIAQITGEHFTDVGGPGYTLNDDGLPLIVFDSRTWWETKGQYQDWQTP